jgi:NADPH:quinone reductase-like Zn-dependent oxidoreductase
MALKQAERLEAPSIPATMRAAAIDRPGPPQVLTVHTVPVPEPGPGEVLIEMHAAGVGVWDAEMRRDPSGFGEVRYPLVLGTDGAGVVVARGARVRRFSIGEPVWAYQFLNPKGGFYAEYVAVDADIVGRIPSVLDLLHAGAAAVTGLTALQGIDEHVDLRQGETALIFGASGAVGTLAVQFARRKRARVLGTARHGRAATVVRELGADGVFDPRGDDVAERLRELAPDGLDAVLALAGGEALERCLDHIRPGGRVAYPEGVEPEPRRRKNVRVSAYDAVAGPREFEELDHAAEEIRLRVPIEAAYPLERAADAHARVEQGHVIGRVVLRIRDDAAPHTRPRGE